VRLDYIKNFISKPVKALINITYGSCNRLKNNNAINEAAAIKIVGMSIILRVAITMTDPTNAPTTAAVIPSTKALIDVFLAIFLK
jgi:hypothetical protein